MTMPDQRRKRLLDQILSHRAALQKYLRRFTAGAEDVEDLVQEAYVRICAMSPAQAVESPRALLFSIARNLAVDRARQRLSHATDDVADFEPLNVFSGEAEPDEQVDLRRRFESFCDVVDSLPPLCRRVFVLRKVYQLSHAEIAQVLGVSHSTIEKHVAKGLLRCRDRLRSLGMLEGLEAAGGEPSPRRRVKEGESR
ncbi:MAG TPA: RNA polymerase sigma factor [Steroidobacteraceae bacterium]|nr:RNA polymerase sigma factor [Steroidobacteraceae bacterium]